MIKHIEQTILRPQLMTDFMYEQTQKQDLIEDILFGILISMFIFDYFIL